MITFSNIETKIEDSKGGLQKRTCHDTGLNMVNYHKNMVLTATNDDMKKFSLQFRSVIFSKDMQRVLCFAPPKSIPLSDLASTKVGEESIIAEEIIEGTMINLFYDTDNGCWEIATKNRIGAGVKFFRDKDGNGKTFRQMFQEALAYINLDHMSLDKHYCYSFVMQHPDNNIIRYIENPKLYLVAVYLCTFDFATKTNTITKVSMEEIKKTNMFDHSCVEFPRLFEKWADLETLLANWSLFFSKEEFPYVPGIMLSGDSMRSKYRNPSYEYLRTLRGNQPKLQFHYLTLRKEYRVLEYLKFFPYHKTEFDRFAKEVEEYTFQLMDYYNGCFTSKEPDALLQKLVSSPRNYAKFGRQISLLLETLPFTDNNKGDDLEYDDDDYGDGYYQDDQDDQDDQENDNEAVITYTDMGNYINTLPVPLLMHLVNL